MTGGRNRRALSPAEYLVPDSGNFSDGIVVEDAPVAAIYLRQIVRGLRAYLDSGESTLIETARRAEISRSTLQAIVAGGQWPELGTVAKLEAVCGRRLWPTLQEVQEALRADRRRIDATRGVH